MRRRFIAVWVITYFVLSLPYMVGLSGVRYDWVIGISTFDKMKVLIIDGILYYAVIKVLLSSIVALLDFLFRKKNRTS